MGNLGHETTDCTYNTFGDSARYQTVLGHSSGHHYNSSVLSAEGIVSKPNKN